LKIQNIPISFSTYLQTLKTIAKNHFIGKTLFSLENFSWDKIVYILFTFALYGLQIYQNVNTCLRFYNNINEINDTLFEMREYTKYSIDSMTSFLSVASSHPSYSKFCKIIEIQREQLHEINDKLKNIRSPKFNIRNFNETGYMLKCFYELHDNKKYEESIRFSMGFEGYINNLLGIHNNIKEGNVSFAEFNTSYKNSCSFREQYYPPLIETEPVKNNCSFSKNIIISSPNKSGKTTILKTTTINIIFTQQIGCGFYSSAILNPYTHIHSYLNIPDTSGRDSLFQAESRRCKEIIDIIHENKDSQKYRHFCIFDELYSGTNPQEACKAGYAFLKYLSSFDNVNFILTTHYVSICKRFRKSKNIQNYKMNVHLLNDGSFEYTYKIKKGISKLKGALRVLKDMNYPKEIIENMENDNTKK
jgi:DNA mismatch repair ATPase MutS